MCLLLFSLVWPHASHSEEPPLIRAHWSKGTVNLNLPGSPSAFLTLDLTRPARIRLRLVGPDGRCVRTLMKDEKLPAGIREVRWDGRDDHGEPVPSEAYTPHVEEFAEGRWVAAYSPCAENHGAKVEPRIVEWDQGAGRLVLHASVPSRLRAWVIRGDDGEIVTVLNDMEPVTAGMASLSWRGDSQPDAARLTYHVKGYALPACALICRGERGPSYLARRSAYPLLPEAAPRAHPDSSPLFREEYATQKALRFRAFLAGDQLTVTPEPRFAGCFRGRSPEARVFSGGGKWALVALRPESGPGGAFEGRYEGPKPTPGSPLTVVVFTDRDQQGTTRVAAGRGATGAAP